MTRVLVPSVAGCGQRKPTRRLGRASACLLLLVSLTLAACTGGNNEGAPTPGAPAQAVGGSYPATIENCGHTLTFNEAPSRAVLGYQNVAEIFVGLGLADRAVGQVGPVVPPLPEQAADFEAIPDVSDFYPPPKEQMLVLRPDFLLAYGNFDYDASQGLATREELKAAGAQVYELTCPENDYSSENLDAVYRTILDLGTIFGVSERAEARVAQMKQQIADVQAKVQDEPPVKVLYYHGGTGPIDTRGGVGIVNELFEAAGGENVFADQQSLYFMVGREAVTATAPEVFVVIADTPAEGPPTETLDGSEQSEFLYQTFPNLPASKNRRAIVSDDVSLGAAGWRVTQTVENLARQLHPEALGE